MPRNRSGHSARILGLCLAGLVEVSFAQVAPAAGSTSQNPPSTGSPEPSAQDIANQVNNPAAPVTLIQFRYVLLPNIQGVDNVASALQMQPVVPIGPFKRFPALQLIKVTFPMYITALDPVNQRGTGDLAAI